jgi:hypothetical protein
MKSLHIFILFQLVAMTKISDLFTRDTFTVIIAPSLTISKARQVLKSLVVKQVYSLYNLTDRKQDKARTSVTKTQSLIYLAKYIFKISSQVLIADCQTATAFLAMVTKAASSNCVCYSNSNLRFPSWDFLLMLLNC